MDLIVNGELTHYGVPGTKWGVRNAEWYPIKAYKHHLELQAKAKEDAKNRQKGLDRKTKLVKDKFGIDADPNKLQKTDKSRSRAVTLKKGQKVNHVTPLDFKELRPDQDLFVSATPYDKDIYRSFLSMMMQSKGFGVDTPIKEVEFTLKQDLKSPSNKTQKKIFESVYSDNKELFDKELDSYYSEGATRPTTSYDAFIKTLDSRKTDSKALFYDAIEQAGYNAVLDQHDIDGSWMQASRPLIIMDAMNTLGDMKVKDLDDKDILKSLQRFL